MTKIIAVTPLLLFVASARALHRRNETNIYIRRVLGAEAEDTNVRRAPPLSDPIHDGPRFKQGEIVIEGSPLDLPPGTHVLKYLQKSNMSVVKVTRGREKALVKKLREKNVIAEENIYAYASMIPNDEYFSPYQWHMLKVQAPQAWDISTGQGVIVAVLDTGLADDRFLSSEDRATYDGIACVVKPYNVVDDNTNVYDHDGHGTHVAGTIAQRTNNEIGAAGLAHGACIMPVKVLDDNGDGTLADIAEGIRYAVDNGAKVINLSLGVDANTNMRRDNGALDKALKYAYAQGVTIVAAAGNENVKQQVSYPSIYPSVLSVGATDYLNRRAPYSNRGDGITLVAPGGNTLEDNNSDQYGDGILQETILSNSAELHFYQGTSMATPHVAAAAALLISANVATSPDDIRKVLTKSALDLGTSGFDRTFGHGLLQVYSALTFKNAPLTPSPTPIVVGRNKPVSCKGFKSKKKCRKQAANGCRWKRRKCRKKG